MENLRALLRWDIIQRSFKTRASSLESTSCDIILKELFIHDIDDRWDEGFDVLGVGNERVDIPFKLVSTFLSRKLWAWYVRLLKSRKLCKYSIRFSRSVYISSRLMWITGRGVAIGKGTNFSVAGMENNMTQ
jgi:hypothetical protein